MLRASASDWPALLGAEPGIGARRVDQRDDRRAELGGQLHQPERLAVALGMRHAEVALEVLLGVAALLVPDDHHRDAAEPRPAAHDRRVVHVEPVAVELDEVGEDGAEVVERVRAAGVAGDHDPLDGREVPVDLRPQRLELALQPLELAVDVDLSLGRRSASGPRSAAPARAAASRTPAYTLRPSGSSRLDVVDGIGAQEIAQGPNEVLLRRDADATGPEPHRLPVPVAPLNIERRRARDGPSRGRRPPGARPARARAGARQRRLSATAPERLELVQRPGRLHDERRVVLAPVPVAVAAGEQQRRVRAGSSG